MRLNTLVWLALWLALAARNAPAADSPPLVIESKISLREVHGRIDHHRGHEASQAAVRAASTTPASIWFIRPES